MKIMQRVLGVFLPLTLVLFVVGCNTVSGLGKDVSAGGQALSQAADKSDK